METARKRKAADDVVQNVVAGQKQRRRLKQNEEVKGNKQWE
jgi:hypothetical protein